MTTDRSVQHCRWATATMFLEAPYWLTAWDYPWSCCRGAEPEPVDGDACHTCPEWVPRPDERDRAPWDCAQPAARFPRRV